MNKSFFLLLLLIGFQSILGAQNSDVFDYWKFIQLKLEKRFREVIGTFPDKRTPLNPKITSINTKNGIVAENLYFESLPNYYVTATFFYPEGTSSKLPTVLFCSGHSEDGYRYWKYQTVILNLVKKGFAVLAFDPIGQGERKSYLDESGNPTLKPTIEHSYPGVQTFLAGRSPAYYFIYDGIRALDYLETRDEVDMNRLGITGWSGGATQTAYIAACDKRIYASVPALYLTTFEMLLKSNGPQDAEQNLIGEISKGIGLADFIEVRAPKPTLMVTTTRDMFSIQGARETYLEAKGMFKAYNVEDNLEMVEEDDVHSSTQKNREASYAFFQKHLNNPGDRGEMDLELFKEEELYATSSGYVYVDLGGEDLHSLSKKYAESQIAAREDNKTNQTKDANIQLVKRIQRVIGYIPSSPGYIRSIFSGRFQEEMFSMENYLIEIKKDQYIPLVFIVPKTPIIGTVFLLDEKGKKHAIEEDLLVQNLISLGYRVILIDVGGVGEMRGGYKGGDAIINDVPLNVWFGSILVGKSIVSTRISQIEKAIQFIRKEKPEIGSIFGLATGALTSDLLHSAALSEFFESGLILIDPLTSYKSLIEKKYYKTHYAMSLAAGGIGVYDLTDLMDLICPRKILIVNPRSGDGELISKTEADEIYAGVRKKYQEISSGENFDVQNSIDSSATSIVITNWMKR